MKYQFKHPLFITSAVKREDYPVLRISSSGEEMDEIAVVGRSNVGKSSLLNHLFQQRDMVKTSSVPGKTQLINFFTLDDRLAFVDLPGYGYAQVPMSVRKKWGPMIEAYLSHRQKLKLILFLFDIRRVPVEEDSQLLEWIAQHDKNVILVLTKVDKVTLNQRNTNTQKILAAFNCENLHYVHYSAVKNVGRKELIAMLTDALKES